MLVALKGGNFMGEERALIGLGWVPISIFKNTFLLVCLNFEKVQTGCLVGNPVGLQLIAFTQSQNFLLDFFSHGTNNNIEFFSKYERFLWVGDHNGSWINEMKPNFARTKSSFGFPIMWINVQPEVNILWMYSLNSSGGPLFKEIRKKKLPDWTILTHTHTCQYIWQEKCGGANHCYNWELSDCVSCLWLE